MPQLDVTTFSSQIFWLVLTFALLYLLLANLIVPRIGSVLENRRSKITSDLNKAEQMQSEALAAQAHYELALKDARRRASSLVADTSAVSEKAAATRIAELEAQLEKKIADAEARVNGAKAEALTKLAPMSQELAQQIVEKLTGQQVSESEVARVVTHLV